MSIHESSSAQSKRVLELEAKVRELNERVGGLVIVLAAVDGTLIQNGLDDFAATIRATVNDVLNPKETV